MAHGSPSMKRDPPEPVKRTLRQEVRFACPAPGCANPVLTWHHFDPPWETRQHHDSQGMVALCPEHHRAADAGLWTRTQLRDFKNNPQTPDTIRKTFMWSEQAVLYRLGGCWAASCPAIISIAGFPVLRQEKSPQGRLLFSLELRSQEDELLVALDQNCLAVEAHRVHDLTLSTGTTRLKVWLAERNIGLELRLRHLSEDELAAQLSKDAAEGLERFVARMPAHDPLRDHLRQDTGPSHLENEVLSTARERCLNSDGKIPVLDVINAQLWKNGVPALVRNGVGPNGAIQSSFARDCRCAFGF